MNETSVATGQGVTFICIESGTPLGDFESDGAKCGDTRHFHARRGSGFLGVTPRATAPTYTDVERELAQLTAGTDLRELPAGHGTSDRETRT